MQLAMIEDKIVALEQLEDVYLDRGTYFGDGVYEVLRSYKGRIFAIDKHFDRLQRSLSEIEITGVDLGLVRSRVEKAFQTAGISEAVIYFHITRGSHRRNHKWPEEISPNFFLTITQLPDNTEKKQKGVTVISYPDLRWKRCDIKSLNLLPNVMAKQKAARKNCYEAILVNDKGLITEGAGSAFFSIKDGVLQTSQLDINILPSITRNFVLMAAEKTGVKIVEKQITPAEAIAADELFIASTSEDIIGVVKFDDHQIGDGKVGEITKKLTAEFSSLTI